MSSPPAAHIPRTSASPRASGRRGQRRGPTPGEGDARSTGSGEDSHANSRRRREPRPPSGRREEARELYRQPSEGSQVRAPVILERRPVPQKPEGPVPKGLLLRNPPAGTTPTKTIERNLDRGTSATTPELAVQAAGVTLPLPRIHKILDQHLRFQPTETVHRALSELPGCFVVGAIGRRGTGKSTILAHFSTSLTTFPSGQTRTNGIDLHVTPERVILLDTQALLLPGGRAPHDEALQTMRLACFILSVCHVVLLVSDTHELDADLLHFVRTMEAVRHRIIPLSKEEQQSDEHRPDLVYVSTKCTSDSFFVESYANMATDFLSWFRGTRIGVLGGSVSMGKRYGQYSGLGSDDDRKGGKPKLGKKASRSSNGEVADPRSSPVSPLSVMTSPKPSDPRSGTLVREPNIFLLPRAPVVSNASSDPNPSPVGKPGGPPILDRLIGFGIPARYEVMMKELRNQVFETPRCTLTEKNPMVRRWYGMSERDWLKFATKTWETIRKSDMDRHWARVMKSRLERYSSR
ncbi:uncharacterized protein SPPG_03277 [Spizellomyces punctatus DAOM BR117]|uniref:G domain-containing protein n=1 Tax=Spizellomyces punctatus (strain DAOM BR117) TaxID=645134 RepID=A0A0L0HK39_SPIPD|nr:uncharacterized protein SPPG_03277 [Spizellomyces punctatus DAOM BR117]KND01477.1 hypothetical protein SPPG_03277 [Spizellomyces punctatus DAOM BR117]|eukprot:XP_016609516.1 hypothetical protein SPPG_03277 [Spizellomyces punctatus DAOM BR117]